MPFSLFSIDPAWLLFGMLYGVAAMALWLLGSPRLYRYLRTIVCPIGSGRVSIVGHDQAGGGRIVSCSSFRDPTALTCSRECEL